MPKEGNILPHLLVSARGSWWRTCEALQPSSTRFMHNGLHDPYNDTWLATGRYPVRLCWGDRPWTCVS
jgi:hypothetical protein